MKPMTFLFSLVLIQIFVIGQSFVRIASGNAGPNTGQLLVLGVVGVALGVPLLLVQLNKRPSGFTGE